MQVIVRLLVVGSPNDAVFLWDVLRASFAFTGISAVQCGRVDTLAEAIHHLDACLFPDMIVVTPSVDTGDAVEILRHVRECGRSAPFIICRTDPLDIATAENVRALCGTTVVGILSLLGVPGKVASFTLTSRTRCAGSASP